MNVSNQRGFTLVEVMISVVIFMTMTLAFASMMSQMNSQMLNSSRKLETLELKNNLLMTLSNPQLCSCLMAKFSGPFNSKSKKTKSRVSELRSNCEVDAPLIVASGEKIPGSQTHLGIKDMSIKNISASTIPDAYSGTLELKFADDQRTILYKNLELHGTFTTVASSPVNAKRIESCSFGMPLNGTGMVGSCPAGEYVSGFGTSGFQCTRLPATIASTPLPLGEGPPAGKGCKGDGCSAIDYGPCKGEACQTNGYFCKGDDCIASGVGAVCKGLRCCAGPHCASK